MFSPKTTPRSNFSSFSRTRTQLASSNARGTPKTFTPQRGSANTPSFRSTPTVGNWSFNVEETATQRLELYGSALPVLVTEALTQCTRSSELSVQLSPRGWTWLVWGRKVLLWRYTSGHGATTKGYSCKELLLPPSDHPYSADLVALVAGRDGDSIGCVAVSPQGTVRYWSNVTHEGSYVEVSCAASLTGTDASNSSTCTAIVVSQKSDCIVATSSSSLILVSLPGQRQNDLRCRLLRPPHGMLSGIGRRMSSLIFGGGGAATQPDAHFYRLVCGEAMDRDSQAFYMLAGSHVQKWAIHNGAEKMLYQCDVEKMLTECMASTVWGESSEKLGTSLQVWLLDVQPTRDGLLLLGAAMNSDVSNDVHFGIGNLHTEGSDPPQSFISFTAPKYTDSFTGDPVQYRLVVPDPSAPSTAYLYDAHAIICVSVNSSSQPVDKVEFHSAEDRLLGGGIGQQAQALFFSLVHGLVTMKGTGLGTSMAPAAQLTAQHSLLQESVAMDQSASTMDTVIGAIDSSKVHEMSISDDRAHRLKAAFLQSCRKNMNEAEALVSELLADDGSDMNRLVVELSREMIDDCPASDPRWAESVPHSGMGGSGSLILQHQLEDKLKAHTVLLNFLKNLSIWQKLSVVTERDSAMETRLLLCEHAEKIAAAVALRELHLQYQPLVDKAIERALESRAVEVDGSLTPHDIFYREVSRMDEVFAELVEYEETMMHGQIKPEDLVSLVEACNSVLLGCAGAAIQHRVSQTDMYLSDRPSADGEESTEYVAWTASTGDRGMRALLLNQYDMTLKEAIREARADHVRAALYQQLMELADRVLEGYSVQLQSIHSRSRHKEMLEQYEQTRKALIMPLLTEHQHERAASLAEKYCDFGVLVQLCETTNDEERLLKYMNQFHARGFAEYVFRWYVSEGLRGKLLASAALSSHPHLAGFLAHEDNKDMSWLHHIHADNYYQAHNTLQDLGMQETQYLAKQKTLLSLSKLCALAADDENAPDDALNNTELYINRQLELITHQEQLPETVLEALGYEPDTMPVMSTKELIQRHVGESNTDANEFDFKKALDLLQYLDKNDEDYERLLLHIWCQAVTRDDWSSISHDNPLENSKDTIFFKTVELVYTVGLELKEYLPPVDKLLACEDLGEMRNNPHFQYLIKAGYEQIQRILT